MRLISYRHQGGLRLGARRGDSLIDLTAALAATTDLSDLTDMTDLLAGGEAALAGARAAIAAADEHPEWQVEETSLEFAPVLPRPPKIICVARNYAEHAAEAKLDVLAQPNLFIRFPRSLIGHRDSVLVPRVSEQVDWEAELAVVIGSTAKHVAAAEALSIVAGYAPFNDVSVRDWQIRKPPIQFGAGKNFDGSGPLGPELVTADEVPDPHALAIACQVNGETVQSSSTADMIFDIPTLIEHITSFTTLEPGDVIATGTPSGVGHFRTPPRYLRAGDTVRVEIEGMAALENPVRDEA